MQRTIFGHRVLINGRFERARLGWNNGRIHLVEVVSAPCKGDELLGNLLVLPGIVDTHVHVNEPGRTEWEGWQTATAAAALGGVTVLADMPLNSDPVTTSQGALQAKLESMRGQLRVDCALWGGVVPGNVAELAPMVRDGVAGFKCFLCHSGIDEFPNVERADLLRAMPVLRDSGVPLLVHAELESELAEAAQAPADDYASWLHARPPEFEDDAVAMMVELCRETRCPVHIVHLSSAGAIDILRAAKAEGLPITAETCPHYLCLKAEDVPRGDTSWKCAPPIRPNANRELLWKALDEGVLDFVVTDHSPCIPGLKRLDTGSFLDAWGGIASLQLGLASVSTEARRRGFGWDRISEWMSRGPAKLLGHGGGQLAVGQRADVIAVDPEADFLVDGGTLAHRHPLTPYQGMALKSRVRHTWLRGHHIVDDGRLVDGYVGRPILGESR